MPQPFSFCLCADDYAMTPGVSRGILEALEARALSATSVLTTSPWWPESAAALEPFRSRASIGLHLNLTLGGPLGPMPLLAPSGQLPAIGTLLGLSWRRRLPLVEIAAEIERQIERFVEVTGARPDHIDGHQHVHALTAVRPLLFDALHRRGWRPWLRDCADRPSRILRRGTTLEKALGIAVLARGFRAEADAAGFVTNDGFSGFSSFDGSMPYSNSFRSYLKSPGARQLVMCHPGHVDNALQNLDPVVETREQELAFLLSPGFRALLSETNASLVPAPSFSRLREKVASRSEVG